jgi:hydrogenase maturation factor
MSSTGTLLAAVSPGQKDRIVSMLSCQGFDARIIGAFSETERRLVEIGGRDVEFPRGPDDPYVQIVRK